MIPNGSRYLLKHGRSPMRRAGTTGTGRPDIFSAPTIHIVNGNLSVDGGIRNLIGRITQNFPSSIVAHPGWRIAQRRMVHRDNRKTSFTRSSRSHRCRITGHGSVFTNGGLVEAALKV